MISLTVELRIMIDGVAKTPWRSKFLLSHSMIAKPLLGAFCEFVMAAGSRRFSSGSAALEAEALLEKPREID
jgi:hypothetical protein